MYLKVRSTLKAFQYGVEIQMKFTALGCDDKTFGIIKSVAMKMGEECKNIVDENMYVNAAASCHLLIINYDDLANRWADLLRQLRMPGGSNRPCLLMIDRQDCAELAATLKMGDADFVLKPLDVLEVEMRIRMLLQRFYSNNFDLSHKCGPYYFDEVNALVSLAGKYINLQEKEFSLALFFFRNANILLTRECLLQAVWTHPPLRESRSLDTLISKVRTKLGLDGKNGFHLTSVYGVGYLLRARRQ
jgi:DNA-binding response OmpR family regulator